MSRLGRINLDREDIRDWIGEGDLKEHNLTDDHIDRVIDLALDHIQTLMWRADVRYLAYIEMLEGLK